MLSAVRTLHAQLSAWQLHAGWSTEVDAVLTPRNDEQTKASMIVIPFPSLSPSLYNCFMPAYTISTVRQRITAIGQWSVPCCRYWTTALSMVNLLAQHLLQCTWECWWCHRLSMSLFSHTMAWPDDTSWRWTTSYHHSRLCCGSSLLVGWCTIHHSSMQFESVNTYWQQNHTSNLTGRHRGPKRKLRAGYRVPSLQCSSYLCITPSSCERYIFHRECGITRFLLAMCVFEVRAPFSFPRLPLCQILFLSQPPLLS